MDINAPEILALQAKVRAAQDEFDTVTRVWIESTVKAIIRRAGECVYAPGAARAQITFNDLPPS
jgi:hypothetical protein